MPEPTVDPTDLLRHAAEVAPKVLGQSIGDGIAVVLLDHLYDETEDPNVHELAYRVLALADQQQVPLPEQEESARDAGVHTGTVALWGEQVGDARQNATRVVDALLVAGWQPPAPDPDGLTVERVAAAIKREGGTIAGFNTLNEWYVRFAKVAARAMMESPEWRGLSRDLLDAQRQLRVVYRERAQLVAVLAHFYPSVWAYSDPAEPEWPVVYVDTPTGQCSWHLHRDDLDLFGHIPEVPADDPRARWDGHSTEEKYQRLAELSAMPRRTLSREQVANVLRHRLRDWHMDVPSSYRTSKFPYIADGVLELLRSAGIAVQEGGQHD